MPIFVSDCPRCGASNITLDVYASQNVGTTNDWVHHVEVYCVCRRCHKSNIQLVFKNNFNIPDGYFTGTNSFLSVNGSLNDYAQFERFITLRDTHRYEAPDHLPDNISSIYNEANSCLASQCFNAAGAMYRLALDLATKGLLPLDGEPNAKIRRSLGLRIEWLFDEGKLPVDLKPLALCVQQDGNDGAHDGTLSHDDAADLQDFAFELLRRIYTEPARLRLAQERRIARRSQEQA